MTGQGARLAAELPDEPRWVETRAMLRSPGATITGGPTLADGVVVKVLHGALSAVAVVGRPPDEAVVDAVTGVTPMTPVIVQTADANYAERALSDAPQRWSGERAIQHRLGNDVPPPPASDHPVRLLSRGDRLDHLPPGLRHEMSHALSFAPIAAVFVDGRAASFCYPCWTTESLWDVSIDTLEEFRGMSLAPHAVGLMIDHMRRQRREPVWGALASNVPSLRLATKLGFRPVDEVVVFSQGPWAFLTAGFGFDDA